MKKFVLLINGDLGLRVLEYISTQENVEIKGVILNSAQKRKSDYLDRVDSLLRESKLVVPIIAFENDSTSSNQVLDLLQASDFGISALFGHVLPKALLERINCEIINLHPSLLPIGRGADPIPWSIIGQQKQGVTIHRLNSGLDTGDILIQKEIKCSIDMNAGKIYEIAANLLMNELEKNFSSWIDGTIQGSKQPEITSSAHRAKDLESIRITKSDEVYTFGYFIRKLQALTFSDGRKPLFLDDSGRLWQVSISISNYEEESQKGKLE